MTNNQEELLMNQPFTLNLQQLQTLLVSASQLQQQLPNIDTTSNNNGREGFACKGRCQQGRGGRNPSTRRNNTSQQMFSNKFCIH